MVARRMRMLWPAWIWFVVWCALRLYACTRKKITICAPDGTPYLDRWFLWGNTKGGGAFLHRFHQDDPDRGWHCHPWFWCESRILRGSYDQEIPALRREWAASAIVSRFWPGGVQTYGPGDVNRIEWHEFHAVRLRTRRVDTLFRYSHKHGRSWGFASEPGRIVMAQPADGVCPERTT